MEGLKKAIDDYTAEVFQDYYRKLEVAGAIQRLRMCQDSEVLKDSQGDLVDDMVKACQAAHKKDVQPVGVLAQELQRCTAPLEDMQRCITQILVRAEEAE